METFKKPLTAAQEKEYLRQMNQGSSEARTLLIEHNMRLVAHIIKKYAFTDKETDDLLSIGTIGLIKAVNTFDVSRGNRLLSREVSLYEPIGTDKEGNEIHLFDVIESGECDASEHYCKKEDICRLHRGIQTVLLPKEKRVVVLRYGLFGHLVHTQKEVGSVLGISRSYVSRIEKSALEKLRSFLMM